MPEVIYGDYLIHFNKNHSPKNGQFVSGDGDGDGIVDDHHYKKLDKMSDKKLYKTLKKEVQSKRSKIHGSGNRWMSQTPIGKKSQKIVDNDSELEKKYLNSKEYKQWESKWNKIQEQFEIADNYDDRLKLERQYFDLEEKMPKRDFNTLHFIGTYGKNGIEYSDNFIKKGGKDLSIAYLEDLGYNKNKSYEYVDRMIKSGYTLGAI